MDFKCKNILTGICFNFTKGKVYITELLQYKVVCNFSLANNFLHLVIQILQRAINRHLSVQVLVYFKCQFLIRYVY
jgi:hypothetical protein